MKFSINKQAFIRDILSPISALNDKCVLTINQQGAVSIANNTENNMLLYLKADLLGEPEIELNIGDIKKLIRALDCIDQEVIEFTFSPGLICYETDYIKFKYHLLQPGLIQKHTIDIRKINSLMFDTEFQLTGEEVSKIIKGTSFATETNKLYFYTKDKQVHVSLTDYTMTQADLIGFRVSEGFSGKELKTELPINIETFKLLQINKSNSVRVQVNTALKIIVFHIKTQLSELKYIVSGLVK